METQLVKDYSIRAAPAWVWAEGMSYWSSDREMGAPGWPRRVTAHAAAALNEAGGILNGERAVPNLGDPVTLAAGVAWVLPRAWALGAELALVDVYDSGGSGGSYAVTLEVWAGEWAGKSGRVSFDGVGVDRTQALAEALAQALEALPGGQAGR